MTRNPNSISTPRTHEKASPESRLGTLLVGTALLALLVGETLRPLRRQREPRAVRTGRNLVMAGLSAAAVAALQRPLLDPVARRVEERKLGLLNLCRLPRPIRLAAGVLLLDYTLWWWHWLNHKVPFFWRFHLVHHIDRDLDASTAARFHFGEMSLSVCYRAAQLRILGIDRESLTLWQTLLLISIFFHHSNLQLDEDFERRLGRIFVTPRLHGIHHSDVLEETDSNWSSLFSWWDSLHGTLRFDPPQNQITIGVPAYQNAADVTLPNILEIPFRDQREDWSAAPKQPAR
jgi:sterol desaturase/sphingolipid hydroxylase (fatty acid hydroxylase superfamily)